MEELKQKLSELGTIEVISNKSVFTLFMKTDNSRVVNVFSVLDLVKSFILDKKNIEVLKNDDDFILIVLKE